MTSTVVESEIREELHAAAERHQCELIHLEFKGGRLRLILDRPEGVTIDDCERVSREASAMLDGLDFGSGRYTLEVSSPGLDRELYGASDYARFVGSRIRITWCEPGSGNRRTDIARLISFSDDEAIEPVLIIDIEGEQYQLRMQDVIGARLAPDF